MAAANKRSSRHTPTRWIRAKARLFVVHGEGEPLSPSVAAKATAVIVVRRRRRKKRRRRGNERRNDAGTRVKQGKRLWRSLSLFTLGSRR